MTVQDNDSGNCEFNYVEYKEACAAYFHGVDIGYTVIRHYATVNALLVILIGALATSEVKNPVLPAPGDIVRIVPWIAIILSVALAMILPHYWNHLENCRNRCVEIEKLYGGRLFSKLAEIETTTWFSTAGGLRSIILLVLLLWLLFAFRAQISDLSLFVKLAQFLP